MKCFGLPDYCLVYYPLKLLLVSRTLVQPFILCIFSFTFSPSVLLMYTVAWIFIYNVALGSCKKLNSLKPKKLQLIFITCLLQEIGELYELERNIEKALVYFERAAESFECAEATTSANQCKQKVAEFSAQLEQ